MAISAIDFKEELEQKVLDLVWGQWSAIRVYSSFPMMSEYLIDPEALLCATSYIGRLDSRLFDECMDWVSLNYRWIRIDRVKTIIKEYPSSCRMVLGALLDYVSRMTKSDKFSSIVKIREEDVSGSEPEPLFWKEGNLIQSSKLPDPVFKEWGLLRNEPNMKNMSSPPDYENPTNLLFKLRGLFGVSARAEVVAFLLMNGGGNSHEISRFSALNQRTVYLILEDLAASGFAYKVKYGKENVFSISEEDWTALLRLNSRPAYVSFFLAYKAFLFVLDDIHRHRDLYEKPYMASSRFRDLLPQVANDLRLSGLKAPAPDPDRYPGEVLNPNFIDYILAAVGSLVHRQTRWKPGTMWSIGSMRKDIRSGLAIQIPSEVDMTSLRAACGIRTKQRWPRTSTRSRR